jgi:hypothetical protein
VNSRASHRTRGAFANAGNATSSKGEVVMIAMAWDFPHGEYFLSRGVFPCVLVAPGQPRAPNVGADCDFTVDDSILVTKLSSPIE